MAENYRFEGMWKVVGELQRRPALKFGINGRLSILMQHVDEYTLFGNILPLAMRLLNSDVFKRVPQYRTYRSPDLWKYFEKAPKRKIRRRGYNDKGSQRPSDKRRQEQPDYELDQKELERKKLIDEFPLREPPSRYWYKSTPYWSRSDLEDPDSSTERKKNHGRKRKRKKRRKRVTTQET